MVGLTKGVTVAISEYHETEAESSPIGDRSNRRRKAGAATTRAGRRRRPAPPPRDEMVDPGSFDLAPMWRRLMARIVDVTAVATWLFALSIAHIFLHLQLWSDTVTPEPWGNWFLVTMTFFVCYAAYEIVFICKAGATPGKDLLRIRVIDHYTGATPTAGQATRRWLLPGIVQPIPGGWPAAVLTAVWGSTALADPDRRSVHDRMAGTRVVMATPSDDPEDDEHRRRRDFSPRIINPLQVYKLARDNPAALKRHPNDVETWDRPTSDKG